MKRSIHCQTGCAAADTHESANQAGQPRFAGAPGRRSQQSLPRARPSQVGRATACAIAGCLLSVALANGLVPPAARAGEPEPVHFGRDILPIFSENCFPCHGPDAKARKADLRLDRKESALRETEAVIVPGKSGESELIKRVASKDASEVMPPPNSGKKLTAHQIELFKNWIDQGAQWSKHWAFEPVKRPAVPPVRNPDRIRNPIDRFVLARLETEGLAPAPPADRATLIRRLDPGPDRPAPLAGRGRRVPRRRQAQRLRGPGRSPAGLAPLRRADGDGLAGRRPLRRHQRLSDDFARTMWPWRDWVIAAFNRNQPFDRFVIEQIAGDLLPGSQPRPEDRHRLQPQ